jgi:hypothetical protein
MEGMAVNVLLKRGWHLGISQKLAKTYDEWYVAFETELSANIHLMQTEEIMFDIVV